MDDAQRGRLRSLLLRLVMPNENGDAVRARVPRAKVAVDEAHVRLVEQLVDARLVSIDGDTVQIAHVALFRVWPRLRGWLDDDVEGQRLFRHLAGAADAWDAMDRPESELYRGMRLTRTLEWRDRARPDLSDTETAFLEASAALSESEQRAAQERVRRERRVNHRVSIEDTVAESKGPRTPPKVPFTTPVVGDHSKDHAVVVAASTATRSSASRTPLCWTPR